MNVFGHISQVKANRYPPAIQIALNYLKNTDFDAMEAGVYELKGRQIYVQVLDLNTKSKHNFSRKCIAITSMCSIYTEAKR